VEVFLPVVEDNMLVAWSPREFDQDIVKISRPDDWKQSLDPKKYFVKFCGT
jgi:hypothetical protein